MSTIVMDIGCFATMDAICNKINVICSHCDGHCVCFATMNAIYNKLNVICSHCDGYCVCFATMDAIFNKLNCNQREYSERYL